MADPDIILYLYLNNSLGRRGAQQAISLPENKSRYIPPQRCDTLEPRNISSYQDRELIEQLEKQRGLESSDCLVLRFSDSAKICHSIVAGYALNIDLPLQKQAGISCFYLIFTFDGKNRLIARDLGSLYRIKVIYNKEEGERWSNFDYLLQGPRILGNKPPVLNIISCIQFKVVMPPRDIIS